MSERKSLFQVAGMFEINEPGWSDNIDKYIAETHISQVHQIGIDEYDILFRCAVCGGEWLFNPLMFTDNPNPGKRKIIFCPGSVEESA